MRQIIVTGLYFCFLNDKLFGFENQMSCFHVWCAVILTTLVHEAI